MEASCVAFEAAAASADCRFRASVARRTINLQFPLPTLGESSWTCQLIVACAILFVLYQATSSYFGANFTLCQFRGPRFAAYSHWWLARQLASTNAPQVFVQTNEKYGPVARIGPNQLLISDPDLTRRILAPGSGWRRGRWFDCTRVNPYMQNIVSEQDPVIHNRLRFHMSAGYSGRDVHGLELVLDERVGEFIGSVESKWLSTVGDYRPVDLAPKVQYYTLDVITHLVLGKPSGFVKQDGDLHGFITAIEEQLPYAQYLGVFLWLNSLFNFISGVPWVRRCFIATSKDATGVGRFLKASQDIIKERITSSSPPRGDMLASFMNRGVSLQQAETETVVSMIAGSDSTATALRIALLHIIGNPCVYARLVAEIRQADAEGRISSPGTMEELQRLPYFQAVIKESLRRFSPITMLREREAPAEGYNLPDGRHIPAGTRVGFNSWGTQLDPIFGDDAEVFRPERWLAECQQENGERLAAMHRTQELVFGHGITRCLGKPIAMMNLNKLLVELLRRYDIQCINNQQPMRTRCCGFFFQSDFHVRITRAKC